MKKYIKKIVLIVVCFLLNSFYVNALTYGGCEYSKIARLKSIVSNVNISYDYYIKDGSAYFNVTINNITPDIYFVDLKTSKTYTYNNTQNGELTIYGYTGSGGNYRFYSALSECYGVKLADKYYKFPSYNVYYYDKLCDENPSFGLCKKWINVNYSYDEFVELLNQYKDKNNIKDNDVNEIIYKPTIFDKFIKFYVKHYYFMLIGIIVVCITIMVISRKKNRFDLK